MKKKVYMLIIGMLLLIPFTANAAAIALTQSDFDNSTNGVTFYNGTYRYELAAGDYLLGENITLVNGGFITPTGDVNLDLNSKSITGNYTYVISLNGGRSLTITGPGQIINSRSNVIGTAVGAYGNSRLTINGGEFTKISAQGQSTVTINNIAGGVLNASSDSTSIINNADSLYINADYRAKVTVNGGNISGDLTAIENSTVTINEGANIAGQVMVAGYAGNTSTDRVTLIVNGGTMRGINTSYTRYSGHVDVTINGGKIETGRSAIYLYRDCNLTIKGGQIKSTDGSGIFVVFDEPGSTIKITDGLIQGTENGLFVGTDTTNILLTGGKFVASGATAKGGIVFTDANGSVDFNSLLGSGYMYKPTLNVTFDPDDEVSYTQKEIQVVRRPNENNTSNNENESSSNETTEKKAGKKEKAKNPKTGDSILMYISMFGLSIIGLSGVALYYKKLN